MQGLGNRPGIHVFIQAQRLFEHGIGIEQGIRTLRHGNPAKVLALGTVLTHVVRSNHGEDGVGAACTIRIGRITRKVAKGAQCLTKRVHMVGVSRYAGHNLSITRLHSTRSAAQAHDPRSAARGHMVQPARGQTKVLGDANGSVWSQRKTGQAQAVNLLFIDTALLDQLMQGAP